MDNKFFYNNYNYAQKELLENKEKSNDFFQRIEAFENVKTIEEAKELARKILPTNQEFTSFYVGNAKCSVVNRSNMFRLCVDTAEKFICYDFSE